VYVVAGEGWGGGGVLYFTCMHLYIYTRTHTYIYKWICIIGGVKTHVHIIAKRAKSKPSCKHTHSHTYIHTANPTHLQKPPFPPLVILLKPPPHAPTFTAIPTRIPPHLTTTLHNHPHPKCQNIQQQVQLRLQFIVVGVV